MRACVYEREKDRKAFVRFGEKERERERESAGVRLGKRKEVMDTQPGKQPEIYSLRYMCV